MKNLLVQGWTRDTITTLAETTYTQAEQALEKKGGDTRYASTSWGLFNEDIRTGYEKIYFPLCEWDIRLDLLR